MNYHKKIQSIGFKRTQYPLVLSEYDRYYDLKDGKQIRTILDHISYLNSLNLNRKSKPSQINISEMGIGGTKEELLKMQTYKWIISDAFSIYITLLNQTYTCFGCDTSIVEKNDKYDKKVKIVDNVFIIHKGKLSNNFWNNILNSLSIQYKREITINQIIKLK